MSRPISRSQAEILCHRLDVPDCIATALEMDFATIQPRCEAMSRSARAGRLVIQDEIDRQIAREAVEGSTWFGCHSDEAPPRQASIARSMLALGRMVGDIIGEAVDVPLY